VVHRPPATKKREEASSHQPQVARAAAWPGRAEAAMGTSLNQGGCGDNLYAPEA